MKNILKILRPKSKKEIQAYINTLSIPNNFIVELEYNVKKDKIKNKDDIQIIIDKYKKEFLKKDISYTLKSRNLIVIINLKWKLLKWKIKIVLGKNRIFIITRIIKFRRIKIISLCLTSFMAGIIGSVLISNTTSNFVWYLIFSLLIIGSIINMITLFLEKK